MELVIHMGKKHMATLIWQDGRVQIRYVDPFVKKNTTRWVERGLSLMTPGQPEVHVAPTDRRVLEAIRRRVLAVGATCRLYLSPRVLLDAFLACLPLQTRRLDVSASVLIERWERVFKWIGHSWIDPVFCPVKDGIPLAGDTSIGFFGFIYIAKSVSVILEHLELEGPETARLALQGMGFWEGWLEEPVQMLIEGPSPVEGLFDRYVGIHAPQPSSSMTELDQKMQAWLAQADDLRLPDPMDLAAIQYGRPLAPGWLRDMVQGFLDQRVLNLIAQTPALAEEGRRMLWARYLFPPDMGLGEDYWAAVAPCTVWHREGCFHDPLHRVDVLVWLIEQGLEAIETQYTEERT